MTSSGVVAMPVMDPASAPAQKHISCCIISAEIAAAANGQNLALNFDVMHNLIQQQCGLVLVAAPGVKAIQIQTQRRVLSAHPYSSFTCSGRIHCGMSVPIVPGLTDNSDRAKPAAVRGTLIALRHAALT